MTTLNHSLKELNTFGLQAYAKEYVAVKNESELLAVIEQYKGKPKFILGGGSNLLLTQDLDATVIHMQFKGIQAIESSSDRVLVEAQGGENWHDFVQYTLKKGWGGLENLSLIPGNVGTTPVQNIGAYGVEIKDRMVSCTAYHLETGEKKEFTTAECGFAYRESIFKQALKGYYIISAVRFELTPFEHYTVSTAYGDIQKQLSEMKVDLPTPKEVAQAVIAIRQSKLPDPNELGNSGSFFKNPIIARDAFEVFHEEFPLAPFYELNDDLVKVPAGWLIEQAGYKGFRRQDAGVHQKQALVLVNYGQASGREIWALAQEIQAAVLVKFGIRIEAEVNVI